MKESTTEATLLRCVVNYPKFDENVYKLRFS